MWFVSIMRTLKLTVAYEGTGYVGWQRQLTGPSIQACLETAFADIEEGPVTVVGAGRTDAGVHAVAQVASVGIRHNMAPDVLQRAVNVRLPADIRVMRVDLASPDFHARFDATAKVYRYRLLHGPVVSPFARRYGWHLRSPVEIERMSDAADVLVGEHDFSAFRAAGSATKTTIRRLFTVAVRPAPDDDWWCDGSRSTVIEVRGSGFLRHMVRVIVGTLVDVGKGARDRCDVERVLRQGDRALAGPTAPPEGLCLMKVEY